MKEKNVKGIIGLCLGLAAVILLIISCIPMTPLTGMGLNGRISFFGPINATIGWVAIACSVLAIVFAVLAKKDADKAGPRSSGMVIGIICIILSLGSIVCTSIFAVITEYVNSNGESGALVDIVKDNPEMQQTIDDFVKGLQDSLK